MNYSLELIRLIAIIIITFTHTRNDFTEGIEFFVFEQIPQIGTVIMSILSGYLYLKITANKTSSLFLNKVKTLLIPFLIANLSVFILVSIAYFGFDKNFLNRLSFDETLITQGIFALNKPSINPPTYFIRDIFILFLWIDIIKNKNFYPLIILIPIMIFGKIFINFYIPIMFFVGVSIGAYSYYIIKHIWKIIGILVIGILLLYQFYTQDISILKIPIAVLWFLIFFNLKIKFFNTRAYTYLLFLYHSPIMVSTYPILSRYIENTILSVLAQIFIALFLVWILYLITRKFRVLRIIYGGNF